MKYRDNGENPLGSGEKRRKKRGVNRLFVLFAAVLAAGAFGMGCYLGHVSRQKAQNEALAASVHALETRAETTETTLPTTTAETAVPTVQTEPETQPETQPETEPAPREVLPQYAEASEANPDMFGWVQIEGTKIDYPVMHTPDDPEKYLHKNYRGENSYAGTPFLDAACTENSDNLIIYGHNMSDGTMFNSLMNYQQSNYWKAHPVIRFDTLYEEGEYEVLAAFYDRVYYKTENVFKFYQFIDAADEAAFDDAIANFKSKSLYDTGVAAGYGDKLITLVTCAYHTDNGRFVVVARKSN